MRHLVQAALALLVISQVRATAAEYPCKLDPENLTWTQTIELRSPINNLGEAAVIEITYTAGVEQVEVAVTSEGVGKMNVRVCDAAGTQLACGAIARA